MEEKLQKQFSVVLKLDQFETLNGELEKFTNQNQREKYIEEFLVQKYGKGDGRLVIAQKSRKAKLTWTLAEVSPEAERMHKEALALAQDKNYEEAIKKWVKAIALNSIDPDYYFNLGIAFFETKNFNESIENLAKVIQICPVYHKAHLILGTAYIKIRKFEQAETYLKESILFHPKHALAYLNLGAVYSIMRKYDEGIEMFQKTLELSPKEVRAHFGLGKIYAIQGHDQTANQYFKKVIEIDTNRQLTNHAQKSMSLTPAVENQDQPAGRVATFSKDVELSYQEGYKAYLFTDYEKSVEMYGRYLEQKPDDDFVWFSLGESHLRNGNASKAAESFQRAASLNSSKGLYYKELAVALIQLGKDDEAIKAIEKALQMGKSDSVLNALYGKLLINQNKFQESIEILEKSLSQDANNLLAKYNLAIAYTKTGEINFAVNYLQEIIRSPMNSPLKMEAETTLKELQPR